MAGAGKKTNMTKPAAIMGTFADLKTVKTRSVVQMVIEIPIEQGAQIIEAFGFPRPGEEVPVAVARMDPEKAKATPAPPEKPRRPFHDLPLSQQAGIRCGDESFWQFLTQTEKRVTATENTAATYVRALCCDGLSRAILDHTPASEYAARWKALNAEYEQYAGLKTEER